jgi:cell envelope opacity-associated protein A
MADMEGDPVVAKTVKPATKKPVTAAKKPVAKKPVAKKPVKAKKPSLFQKIKNLFSR